MAKAESESVVGSESGSGTTSSTRSPSRGTASTVEELYRYGYEGEFTELDYHLSRDCTALYTCEVLNHLQSDRRVPGHFEGCDISSINEEDERIILLVLHR